jgi:ribosomal protein S18 acetylase RimI-like enzyme|tara:strand:- start:714 stop:1454 length:741 start_codon:yes stop_codon:yes gene_type:complete
MSRTYAKGNLVSKAMTSDDKKRLLNPVWEAISGPQLPLAEIRGQAGVYDMDVSPFGAVESVCDAALNDLADLCSPGRIVALMYKDATLPDCNRWELIESINVWQMIYREQGQSAPLQSTALSDEFVDRMIELVRLTNPGPFGKRTIELGDYLGVVESDRLLAMAGERFKPPHWVEVSGVCTHPSAQGRGYAAGLVTRLVEQIEFRDQRAFLHVRAGSPSEQVAIGVYERLGFEHYQRMDIAVLQRR